MDRGGAWWATVHRVAESDTTEQLTLKAIDLSLKFSLTKSGETISLGGFGNQFVLMRL